MSEDQLTHWNHRLSSDHWDLVSRQINRSYYAVYHRAKFWGLAR